jgi:hypothetical protein
MKRLTRDYKLKKLIDRSKGINLKNGFLSDKTVITAFFCQ